MKLNYVIVILHVRRRRVFAIDVAQQYNAFQNGSQLNFQYLYVHATLTVLNNKNGKICGC